MQKTQNMVILNLVHFSYFAAWSFFLNTETSACSTYGECWKFVTFHVFTILTQTCSYHFWHSFLIPVNMLCWCFMALRHFSCHFGHSQLTYPHCSWASLLGSLPVLSAHSFASNWQLPFLNQQKEENGCRNYFMTKIHERMLPDVRIEPTTIRIPGGCISDWATAVPVNILAISWENCLCHMKTTKAHIRLLCFSLLRLAGFLMIWLLYM